MGGSCADAANRIYVNSKERLRDNMPACGPIGPCVCSRVDSRDGIQGPPGEQYIYCKKCNRAFEKGHCRRTVNHELDADPHLGGLCVEYFEYCPYQDCDGYIPADGLRWSEISKLYSYPDEPVFSVVYPIIGETNDDKKTFVNQFIEALELS